MLRNHGRKDKYLHEKIGFNLRFNEIQAAVGREQLKVLDNLNAGRRRAAQWYRRELASVKEIILPPADSPETESVYHMFVIRLDNHDVRESLARYLREQGIETGDTLSSAEPFAAGRGRSFRQAAGPCRERKNYVKRILSLPMFPSLGETEVAAVSGAIKSFLAGNNPARRNSPRRL